jgi:hypothetical protein
MTPRQYWVGWALMALGWLVSLVVACWYLGSRLDAILKALDGAPR